METNNYSNQPVKIDVLSEIDNFLFINKPAGLMVHSDGRSEEKTLSDFLLEKYPDLENVGEPWFSDDGQKIKRPGIVHRLDKQTSGIMVIAKNQESFEFLKEKFQNREVKKKYVCIVFGQPKEFEGSIDVAIGRSRKDFRKRTTSRGARGKTREAQTDYKTIGVLKEKDKKFALMEVWPKTGRTHQIRVHFKHLGHPLIADDLYAGKNSKELNFDRLALHAVSLIVPDMNGKGVKVNAPLPQDFQKTVSFFDGVDKNSLIW